MKKDISLKDLCGIHKFEGFELSHKKKVDCGEELEYDVVKFMLDDITYEVEENPDDGYRSYCEKLKVSNEKPKYMFSGCEVLCKMKPNGAEDEHDVLIGRDTHTELVVFEIGTMYINDYYPYCHFEYHPENMFCNKISRM